MSHEAGAIAALLRGDAGELVYREVSAARSSRRAHGTFLILVVVVAPATGAAVGGQWTAVAALCDRSSGRLIATG